MIITIAREAGCRGMDVARILAYRLGYRLVDRQVIAALARETGVPYRVAAERDETVEHWFERLTAPLDFTPEAAEQLAALLPAKSLVEITEKLVGKYAEDGNVVILGRAGAAILGGRKGVLHVFLHASAEWRAQALAANQRIPVASAREQVDGTDRQRGEYLKAYYDREWRDPSLYDLCINMERVGVLGAVALIEAALRALGSLQTRAA